MENIVGRILKTLGVIVMVFAAIVGVIALFGGIELATEIVGITTGSAWLAALAIWAMGFVNFIFLYAAGTAVGALVDIRNRMIPARDQGLVQDAYGQDSIGSSRAVREEPLVNAFREEPLDSDVYIREAYEDEPALQRSVHPQTGGRLVTDPIPGGPLMRDPAIDHATVTKETVQL